MAVGWQLATLLALSVVPGGQCQVDTANRNTPGTFFLDSNADCNGPVRELYGQSARVLGAGADQSRPGPQSCTLTLKSTSNYEQTNIQIQIVRVTINQDNVRFTIYDGEAGQQVLRAYDKNSQNKPNERLYLTSGDTVAFILERQDITNSLFDIEITVTPLSSGVKPGYENDYGSDFGFFREKLPNEAVVGIIGGILALCLILIIIFVVCCYRRYKGFNEPWEQHQLSAFQPPSVYETKSKMSDDSSNIWASNLSRGGSHPYPSRPQSRMPRHSEDEDSVFDDETPPKKKLLELEQQRERERQREQSRRARHQSRGGYFSNQNDSFVQADDDHPQETFIERVIEPRVRQHRSIRPPSYSEAVSDTETETEKTEVEDEEDDVDDKQASEEDEEEPQAESESEAETSQSSEEEEEEEEIKKPGTRPRQPQQAGRLPAVAAPSQPAYPPYPPMQYVGGYPMVPGQFVPVMAAPMQPQLRPLAAGPGFPPPRYPGEAHPARPSVRPTDPPVYSYLVQRGYTPLDGRHSPASSTNISQASDARTSSLDERDTSQLHSGVEYMRR